MNRPVEKRLLLVWLALSTITLAQLAVGSLGDRSALTPNAVVTTSAIVIALVKVRVIIREFMEVRHAPRLLCRLTDLWIVLTGLGVLGGYYVGRALSAG